MDSREKTRELARQSIAAGDPLGWFEKVYASARGDAQTIPWADLKPNINLTNWLNQHPQARGKRALVTGCGLGDDAEELSRRELITTAFDISPTAIKWCNKRFPDSTVQYATADLTQPPTPWKAAFDFVFESYTLQVLQGDLRQQAMKALMQFLAPGGALLIVCRGRDEWDPPGTLPWPLTRAELNFFASRLVEKSFEDYPDPQSPQVRRFRCLFQKR